MHICLIDSNVRVLHVVGSIDWVILLAYLLALGVGIWFLVYEREPNIVLKLRDGKIELQVLLAVLVHVHLLQQVLRERTN